MAEDSKSTLPHIVQLCVLASDQKEHLNSGDIAAEYIGPSDTLPYSAASQHVKWHRPLGWIIRGREAWWRDFAAWFSRVRQAFRPKSDKPKELVTVRLDADVLAFLRAGGPGWQTRLNALVAAAAKRAKKPKRGATR